MKSLSRPPPSVDLVCFICGNKNFFVRNNNYYCKRCRKKHARKVQSGSGVIAGPCYHRQNPF